MAATPCSLLLLGLLLQLATAQFSSTQFRCPSLGVHRDPTNCQRFFVCSAVPGATYLQAVSVLCPIGTVFSSDAGGCDVASRVPECNRETCSPGGSTRPHPTSCTRYVECPSFPPGPPVIRTCSLNSVFSTSLSQCSSSSNALAECYARTFRCPTRRPPSFAPLPGLCTHYLRCSAGNPTASILRCPEGYWFHPRYLSCTIPPTMAICPKPFLCPYVGTFPSRSDCAKYYSCPRAGVIGTLTQCPQGYFLAGEKLGCRPAAEVPECSSEGLPRCLASGRFHHTSDCGRAIFCSQNARSRNFIQTTYTCPQGFYFDLNRGVCDWPARVGCSASFARVWI